MGGDTDLDVVDGHRNCQWHTGNVLVETDRHRQRMLTRLLQCVLHQALMSCMGVIPWLPNQNVKQSMKKTRESELIKRQMTEWELKKPSGTRDKVWDQDFKYENCPKGTPNGWEHHVICKVCLGENVGNTVVKLGSCDLPQTLGSHFLHHHKEEWINMQKEKQSSIVFTSRDSTGKSTHPSPLRTPTAEQHRQESLKLLFDWITGPGGWGKEEVDTYRTVTGNQYMDGLSSWWIRILWCGGKSMLKHFRT